MIVLQLHDLYFIMTTSAIARMHVTFWTPIARCLIQAIGIIAIHAIMKIHQYAASEGQVNYHRN